MGKIYRLLKRLILKIQWVSLVNLVVNREIVTELLGDQMNEENVAKELEAILPRGNRREQMLKDYDEMNRKLGPAGASERAAQIMIQKLRKKDEE